MAQWLIVDAGSGKPLRMEDAPSQAKGEGSIDVTKVGWPFEDYAFATFNRETLRFDFEMQHYVTIDDRGVVCGDVYTNRPVIASPGYTVLNVTYRNESLGALNGQVCTTAPDGEVIITEKE